MPGELRFGDLRLVPAALLGWLATLVLVEVAASTAFLVATAIAVTSWVTRRWPSLAVVGVVVATVSFGCALRLWSVEASPVRAAAHSHRTVTAEVQVRLDPVPIASKRGPDSLLAAVIVRRMSLAGAAPSTRVRAVAFVPGNPAAWQMGRTFVVQATLTPADSRGEAAALMVHRWSASGATPRWWALGTGVRRSVGAAAGDESAAAALVPALVTGDDARLSDTVREQFRTAGLTHLLAVSGTNVTIILGAVAWLVGRFGRRTVHVVSAVALVVFVLAARPEPSVLRAGVMGVVGLLGLGIGPRDGSRALAWAVIVLLMVDPWLARSAGFALSVLATGGIIGFAPTLAARLEWWLPRWCALAVAVPVAAQIVTLPVVVALSGTVSLVAVAANLVAGPAVAPATVLGMAAGMVQPVWPWLAHVVALPAVGAAWVIVATARVAAGLDGAAFAWGGPTWLLALLTPLLGWVSLKVAARPVLAVGVSLGVLVAIVHPPSTGWPPDHLVMVSCDVGQGDGTVLPVAPGQAVVVDTGEEPGPIDRCLRRLGVDRIRLLVFTHSDADHTAGWRGAVRGRTVDGVMVGPSGGPDVPGVPRYETHLGDDITIGAVRLETLWPGAHPPSQEPNDVSIVQRATVHGVRVLLAADVGEEAQNALLREHPDVTADVLKVSHHGSADQSPRFVGAVGARLAIVSVGADNDYGHPTPRTLSLLATDRMVVRRTDRDGDVAVALNTDGGLIAVTH